MKRRNTLLFAIEILIWRDQHLFLLCTVQNREEPVRTLLYKKKEPDPIRNLWNRNRTGTDKIFHRNCGFVSVQMAITEPS